MVGEARGFRLVAAPSIPAAAKETSGTRGRLRPPTPARDCDLGLAPRGELIVVGAARDPLAVGTADLIFGKRTISGSLTGTAIENEDNLAFSLRHRIRPMTETMPLAEVPAAHARMMSRAARFRVVLIIA